MAFDPKWLCAAHLRAARGLLNWSLEDLARAAKVGRATVYRFENGQAVAGYETREALVRAVEAAGVELLGDQADRPGARLAPGKQP